MKLHFAPAMPAPECQAVHRELANISFAGDIDVLNIQSNNLRLIQIDTNIAVTLYAHHKL